MKVQFSILEYITLTIACLFPLQSDQHDCIYTCTLCENLMIFKWSSDLFLNRTYLIVLGGYRWIFPFGEESDTLQKTDL